MAFISSFSPASLGRRICVAKSILWNVGQQTQGCVAHAAAATKP
ncbi:hypothetical protein [Deefgea tanakiae]|nr:hypothetical protein [Deefgea tanakiae]